MSRTMSQRINRRSFDLSAEQSGTSTHVAKSGQVRGPWKWARSRWVVQMRGMHTDGLRRATTPVSYKVAIVADGDSVRLEPQGSMPRDLETRLSEMRGTMQLDGRFALHAQENPTVDRDESEKGWEIMVRGQVKGTKVSVWEFRYTTQKEAPSLNSAHYLNRGGDHWSR